MGVGVDERHVNGSKYYFKPYLIVGQIKKAVQLTTFFKARKAIHDASNRMAKPINLLSHICPLPLEPNKGFEPSTC